MVSSYVGHFNYKDTHHNLLISYYFVERLVPYAGSETSA